MPDISEEIKSLVEDQGRAWEAFKKSNDERLAAIESKGYAPASITEEMSKISTDLSKTSADVQELMKVQARNELISQQQEGKGKTLTPEQLEHKNALRNMIKTGDDSGLLDIQKKAMNSQTDPDGGYLVTDEMDNAIDRFAPIVSAMSRLARNVQIGGPMWKKLVKTRGMSMTRVGDGQTNGESTEPQYSLIEVPVYSAEVEPWVYNEMLEDSIIDLEADLVMEAGIGFAEGAGAEFISGNGVNKARGITSYTNVANASYAWGKVGYIASGKSGAFASVAPADAFVQLQHALKSQYRPGAVWLMNDTTLGVARQMKDASGQYYLWNPDPLAGFGGRFLGSPVEIDDNMPVIAANSYSVAYGNFQRGYAIVNRTGTALIRDNITSKGKTKFNFRRRFGGGITQFEAIKLMKFATS